MKNVLVFGCGQYYDEKKESIFGNIIGFIDNFKTGFINGIKIYTVNEIKQIEYDAIYIMVGLDKLGELVTQLIKEGVPAEKIIIGQNLEPKSLWEKEFMPIQSPFFFEKNVLIYNNGKVKVRILENRELPNIVEFLNGNGYGYELPYNNNVVIDIGMNIGLASLYFAAREGVKCVYGYEPFYDTYQNAIANFELNSNLKKKINAVNAGISNKNEQEKILYNSCMHGALTTCKELVNETVEYQKKNNDYKQSSEKYVEIQLLDAADEIKNIICNNNDSHFILKMDCEGSEYAILEELEQKDILKYFDCIMLEWHYRGSEQIKETLINAGFGLFESTINEYYGLISAIKMNK